MFTDLQSTITLENGTEMPCFGLGVFEMKAGFEVEMAVRWALQAGYRSIDTASIYRNEASVGEVIRTSEIPRDEIFLTTKVWNQDQRTGHVAEAFETSLTQLGLDYVDLYLVHWPVENHYKETWRTLEAIYESGRAKAIGVSNFMLHHLQDLLEDARIRPMINQIEFHPYLQQPDLVTFCQEQRIQIEAYSPLMKGRVLEVPALKKLAKKHRKNPVQIALRWLLQQDIIVIPKSIKKQRIQENANVFDFELSAKDMAVIDGLDRGSRVGPSPYDFSF